MSESRLSTMICLIRASVVAMLCALCPPASASTTYTSDSLQIREGTPATNYTVTFSVAAGQMVLYANGENCGNSSHRTRNGLRYFEHFHITYTLPKTGTDQFLNARTIDNAGEIDAYWDTVYPSPNYTRYVGADHTYNCWGYALWKNVWIQDPAWVYADDYDDTTDYKDENIDCPAGHVIYIPEVWDCGKIKKTREKNRESGRYYREYASPGVDSQAGMKEEK